MASFKDAGANHPFLEMPDIENEYAAGYLIGLLYEAGLMSSSGMGPVPISWVEISAWTECLSIELTPWEKLMVKQMSEDYVAERCETDPNRPAPYSRQAEEAEDLQEDRARVNDKIMSLLGSWVRRSDSEPTEVGEEQT